MVSCLQNLNSKKIKNEIKFTEKKHNKILKKNV